MADPDNSSGAGALPTQDELNRTLLRPPFGCRFCGFAGGDFLGLFLHSLGVHPINYVRLRDHVEAHGSHDGFKRLYLPLPERPRNPGCLQVADQPSSPHEGSAEDASTANRPLQDEGVNTAHLHQIDEATRNSMETEKKLAAEALAVTLDDRPIPSSPPSFHILSEDFADDSGEKAVVPASPPHTKKKTISKAKVDTAVKARRRSSRSPLRPSRRRRRSSSRGPRRSPSSPWGKRRRSSSPIVATRTLHGKVNGAKFASSGTCRRPVPCSFTHGECPELACRKGACCFFDHTLDATYMCLECFRLANTYNPIRRFPHT